MLLCSVTHQNTLKISGFKTRVQDLWSALLAENFVFSFKNTLEIAAYRKLEEMYADWTWRLRSRMLDIENKLKIKIENDRKENVKKEDLEAEMQKEYKDITKDMECYFSEDKDQVILIQWKRNIEQKVADVKEQIIGETKRKFEKLIRMKKSCWDLEKKKSKYEDQLLRRSKELALKLKAKDLDGDKLEREFEKLWTAWVCEVSSDMPLLKKMDVEIDTEQILIDRLVGEPLFPRRQSGSYRNLQSAWDFSDYISIKKKYFFKTTITTEEANQLARRLTQDIIRCVTKSIKEKERANVDYSPTFMHEIVNKILKDIQDFESQEKRFVFNNNYKTDLCLMLCYQAALRFQEMHNAFQLANDPLTYLKNKKVDYFGIFTTSCKGATSTTGLADFVSSKLKEAIHQQVYNKTNKDLAGEIRSNTPAFRSNRFTLESHILKTLAEDENFDKFMRYIHFPKQYFEEFISQSIDNYCWDGKNPRILKVFRKSLEHFKTRVTFATSKSTEVVQDKNGNVPVWLDEFCDELKEDLEFTRGDLKSVEYQEIKDIKFLKEAMMTVLEHVVEDLEREFTMKSSTNTKSSRTEIQDKLFEHLCGCWEQCPFCNAICTNTISDHDGDHSVGFHRPQGICAGAWYKTDNLVTDICSSLVASNCNLVLSDDKHIPFRNYREAGPRHAKWSITPDSSLQPYWKWFVCKFQSDLGKKIFKKISWKG
ncbi:Interferon-induced very large GTPase 1 [Acipenser ruthenus]|uniref:Interferon-induced very large GTPase 1 n=1 Tax=Acipenser ruthenus TaxID=7906 RepID=A0A444V232_ACIRT|nr:Interferon-induced very large GTPase 1 [Acipenser ruthenus]